MLSIFNQASNQSRFPFLPPRQRTKSLVSSQNLLSRLSFDVNNLLGIPSYSALNPLACESPQALREKSLFTYKIQQMPAWNVGHVAVTL